MEEIIWEYFISVKDGILGLFLVQGSRTSITWLGTSVLIGFGAYLYLEVKKFGTLYIPTEKEDLQFGISKENPNPHKTVKDAYLLKG